MNKCNNCPVDGKCVVEWTGHTRYCDMAENDLWKNKIIAESKKIEMPPLTEQAGNLVRSIGGLANAMWNGKKIYVPDAIHNERKAICDGCELRNGDRCSACGCFIAAKTALAHEKCPVNPPKWLPYGANITISPGCGCGG